LLAVALNRTDGHCAQVRKGQRGVVSAVGAGWAGNGEHAQGNEGAILSRRRPTARGEIDLHGLDNDHAIGV
jgi:hypothetical protein